MSTKNKLINKVKHLCKVAQIPKWFHHFGPKRFQAWQHLLGLLVKEVFRLSYRRASCFLEEFYSINVHWTTLQKFRQRLPLYVWQKILAATTPDTIEVAAVDGTSLQRSNPSEHYLKKIASEEKVSIPVYLNAMVDVIRRKFVAIRHHAKKASEVADVYYFMERIEQDIDLIVMDKAYDSEKLHRYLRQKGTWSVAPVKKNWAKGQLRKQLKECFDYSLYWQRNLVECLFSALKRLFGNHLRGLTARTQRAELYMRLIAYNIRARIMETFY